MKDCLDYVTRKYLEFYIQHHYVPKYFVVYNAQELTDFACTLATTTGAPGHIGNILIAECEDERIFCSNS